MAWITPFPPPQSGLLMVALFLILLISGCNDVVQEEVNNDVVLSKTVFENSVMPAINVAGCAASDCHDIGGPGGGFRIDLNAAPGSGEMDTNYLSAAFFGNSGERSMILLKPLGSVVHSGGQVFSTTDTDYQAIFDWVTNPIVNPQQ